MNNLSHSAQQDLRLDLREAAIHRQFGARDETAVVAGHLTASASHRE